MDSGGSPERPLDDPSAIRAAASWLDLVLPSLGASSNATDPTSETELAEEYAYHGTLWLSRRLTGPTRTRVPPLFHLPRASLRISLDVQ